MLGILQEKPNWPILCVIAMLALGFNVFASGILSASYEASQFPVPYYEAQLSFSAERLKGWYEYLVANNTMDIYIQTQHIDFIFIVSILILHVSVILLCSRLFLKKTKLRKMMVYAAIISASAPMFDVFENLVSYLMIASHVDFPEWQAMLYSGLALAKFVMFIFGYLVVGLSIIAWMALKILKRGNPRQVV